MADESLGRVCNYAIVVLALLYVSAIFAALPFATSDGPVHITFGNFRGLDRDANPLLFQHYRHNDALSPNVVVYMLIEVLLKVFTPAVTESLVQVFCTVGVVASAWLALRQIGLGQDKTWLALLVFSLVLHRLFFLGLYSFCFSVIGFFLVIGSFLRLQNGAARGRAVAVVAALYFTVFAHAAGFLVAVLAVSALILAQVVLSLRAGERWSAIMRAQHINLLVLASPLPLVLLLLHGSGNAPFAYGIGLEARVLSLVRLEQLRVHSGLGEQVAKWLSPILFGGVAAVALGTLFKRRHASPTRQRNDALGALAMFVAMLLLALAFPDTLGGGWIHFQRMTLFLYFGAVLCLAYCPIPKGAQIALASFAVVATVTLLTDAVIVQREVARQMRPLIEVDRLIGSHCSVLPLVLSLKPLDEQGHSMVMTYPPYIQIASKLELTRDRVVLFNYHARTDLYPARFRNGHDTQDLIFNWAPMQESNAIRTIEIERFEESSGMPVDYILQWGPLGAASPELRRSVLHAEQGAELVYESQDGRVSLFRRATNGQSRCEGGRGR